MIGRFFRLLIHAAGLYASIPVGVILGILLDGIVLHTTVAPGLSGIPHLSTWILAGIVSGLIGGVLVEQDRGSKGYYLTIVLRTFVAMAWWPVLRLACLHPHALTSALLGAMVILLLTAAGAVIYGLVHSSRRADLAAYALTAIGLIGFGVFLQGDRVLTLTRMNASIDGRLRTLRWCGLIETDDIALRGVHGSAYKSQSDAFDDVLGDGAVLLTADRPVLIPGDSTSYDSLGNQFRERFDEIQEGNVDTLTFVEPLPNLRLHWTMFFAGMLVLAGALVDPVSVENRRVGSPVTTTKWKFDVERMVRWTAASGVLIGLGAVAVTFAVIIGKQRGQLNEMEKIAGSAEWVDIEIQGRVLVGNACRIKATRSDFADEDVIRLAPLVSGAGTVELDLSGAAVTDAALAKLRLEDSIFALRLRKTLITPAALLDISHINPTLLDVRETTIRAKELAMLKAPNLEYLLITDPTFKRDDVAHLIRFKRLKFAQVEQARLSQADLKFWSVELQDLTLVGIQIDPVAEVETAGDFGLLSAYAQAVIDGPIQEGPIVQVVRQYVAAIATRDTYALKTLWDMEHPTNVRELPDDWWEIRPVTIEQFSGAVQSSVAKLRIVGKTESGKLVAWDFELIKEAGRWKVKREHWSDSTSLEESR